jgi:predicted transcriptional regulator
MFLPTHEKQFEFWKMRRGGHPNVTIAGLLGISRQAVSRALLAMDGKIESGLREMARANQIEVKRIDPVRGILSGRSIPLSTDAIIFVSEKHGMQVWYEHEGNCTACPRYAECTGLLRDVAAELGIRIRRCDDPTKMAEELFAKVKDFL